MIDPLLKLTLAVSLALLFFLAARHKQAEGLRFEAQLGAYRILPPALLRVTARLLPLAELAIAVGLLLPATRTAATLAAAALLAVYALAMGINLLRGRDRIDCGCGASPQPLSGWLVGRNAVLAGTALLVSVPAATRPLGPVDYAMFGLMTVLLSLTYAMAGQLMANHSVLRHWSRDLG
jgi:hypothetical protein